MAWSVPKIGTLATGLGDDGNITLTEPAGIAEGDLMVACLGYRGSNAFTLPSGWSLVATQQSSGDIDATNGIASGGFADIERRIRPAMEPDPLKPSRPKPSNTTGGTSLRRGALASATPPKRRSERLTLMTARYTMLKTLRLVSILPSLSAHWMAGLKLS